MIRPFTCVCLMLAAGSGLYLYQTKHRALMLDRDIAHLMKVADAARERAGVLRAEYALLNDTTRLKDLATQHLSLQTTAPTQFASAADFEKRLPPVGLPPAPSADPVLEPPAAAPISAPIARAEPQRDAPRTETARAEAPRAPAMAKPAILAANAPLNAPATSIARIVPAPPRPAAPAPSQAARSVLAAAQGPAQGAAQASGQAYAGLPPPQRPTGAAMVASIVPATQRTPLFQPPPATTAEAIARIARGGPVDTSSPVVASALGMARSMMHAPSAVAPASAAQFYPQGNGG